MSTIPESTPPVQDAPVETDERETPELREADERSLPETHEDHEAEEPQEEGHDEQGGQDETDADGGDQPDAPAAGPDHRHDARTEDLVREGEVAADFLEALLDIADLAGDLEVDIERDRAAVAIVDSEDGVAPRRLVGPGGNVLDALQELTRLAVQADTGERSRLMLDVAGYRADRRAALVKAAQAAIAEVRESGAPRELEPMTAFERKVVHDEVLAAGLHSESEGAEPSRYVVIKPSA